ncbi:hypothetical protein ColKHC_07058 [Colletotrichum higginsianum]|nr:hypothetical protein ColKHC_07058 [Colletotrichum higginsianum]
MAENENGKQEEADEETPHTRASAAHAYLYTRGDPGEQRDVRRRSSAAGKQRVKGMLTFMPRASFENSQR